MLKNEDRKQLVDGKSGRLKKLFSQNFIQVLRTFSHEREREEKASVGKATSEAVLTWKEEAKNELNFRHKRTFC